MVNIKFDKLSPYYDDKNVTIFNDDCFHIMKKFNDNIFNLILTDPPYGTTSCEWDQKLDLDSLWKILKRIGTTDCSYIFTGTQPFTSKLIMSNLRWFKYEWIWHKSKCGSSFTAKYRPHQKHENILVFGRGKIKYNPQLTEGVPYSRIRKENTGTGPNNHKLGVTSKSKTVNSGYRYPETVQYFQQKWRRQDQVHPTQKPVELMEYLIKTYTNENDIVLDPFMGSGTTIIAARNLNRKVIGIEINKKYCDTAIKRLNENI